MPGDRGQSLRLTADRPGERLDVFLARAAPQLSRSRAQKLIEGGFVSVGEGRARPSRLLERGEVVRVTIPPPEAIDLAPEAMPLTVIYEDADLIVVDKPAGVAVHPAPGHPSGTLVNALLALCTDLSGIGGELRPGIVHRLDKDTSGLMVVAKNDSAHRNLARQLKERQVEKTYLALVEGRPAKPQGTIEAPIARHPQSRQRMAIEPGGRESRTDYRVLETIDSYSLVEAKPLTGRTHQIRVHLASLGCPITGDTRYGKRSPYLERQFLHAQRLAFALPSTGERREFESPLPADLSEALESIRRDAVKRRRA
ncbi:MAG TPA: RluA family pseudouridine synthase [Dehalococcoidia bacterium]|nr:RluA family pseudouridine synthase [Dehalococcoidia bacterium]